MSLRSVYLIVIIIVSTIAAVSASVDLQKQSSVLALATPASMSAQQNAAHRVQVRIRMDQAKRLRTPNTNENRSPLLGDFPHQQQTEPLC